jgi:hypothetical protein
VIRQPMNGLQKLQILFLLIVFHSRAEAQIDSLNYTTLDIKSPEILSISTAGGVDQKTLDAVKTKLLFLSLVDSASYHDFEQRIGFLTAKDKDVVIAVSEKVSMQRPEFMFLIMKLMADKIPLQQAYNEAKEKIISQYKVLDFKSLLILKE